MPESVEVLRMEAEVFEEEGLVDPDELSGLSLSSEAGEAPQPAPATCAALRLLKYSCWSALSAVILPQPSNLSIAWWMKEQTEQQSEKKMTRRLSQHE